VGKRVTIGVPVYNGANYLERALSSLADQTYADIRVLISDNASTDDTEAIARSFASSDERFEYWRNDTNIGAVPNYDKVFYAATTPYFKWAAHDDWIEPRFVEACVEALDANPGASLAYTGARQVDENDVEILAEIAHTDITDPDPVARFREVVRNERLNLPIFGLMRREVLGRTHLQGTYHASARVLLGELALLGPFIRVPDILFVHRNHPEGSLRSYGGAHGVRKWYDTSSTAKGYFPRWMYMKGLADAAEVAPLSTAQKLAVRSESLRWGIRKPKALAADLVIAAKVARADS
jgi:glycosyltransferase involved in cell wall biosynthesis